MRKIFWRSSDYAWSSDIGCVAYLWTSNLRSKFFTSLLSASWLLCKLMFSEVCQRWFSAFYLHVVSTYNRYLTIFRSVDDQILQLQFHMCILFFPFRTTLPVSAKLLNWRTFVSVEVDFFSLNGGIVSSFIRSSLFRYNFPGVLSFANGVLWYLNKFSWTYSYSVFFWTTEGGPLPHNVAGL